MRLRTITWLLVLGFLVGGIAARVAFLRTTLVVVDEFQHLHAAYLVAQGETPYVDFFEHHPPLAYFVMAGLVPMDAPRFATIVEARYLVLILHLLTVALAGLWVRAAAGRREALVAVCLLLGNFFLFGRASLVYLDAFAAPLLVASAWALGGSRGRPLRALVSGLSLGLALLVTQKALAAAVAPLVVFAARALDPAEGRRGWGRDLAAYAAGGLAAALLLAVLLGRDGVAGFVRDAVVLNLQWKARHFPTRELLVLALTDGVVFLVALVGLGLRLRGLVRRRLAAEPADMPALFLAALGTGIFLLPVVWEEYFVLLVPFAVIVAAMTLVDWWQRYVPAGMLRAAFSGTGGRQRAAVAIGLAAVAVVDLLGRRLVAVNTLSLAAFVAVPALWLVLGASLAAVSRRSGAAAARFAVALLVVFPVVQQLDWIHHNSNAAQRARVDYVVDTTSGGDAVFDGYSGAGVFRPHAYRYWFLHEEMRAMLSEEDRGPNVVRALEARRPAIVIVDRHVAALPDVVREHVEARYTDTAFPDIKRRKAAETDLRAQR
jgi:hypothetical protein